MNRRNWFGAMVVGTLLVAGCGKVEMRYAISEDSKKELASKPAELEQLATTLDEVFGTPDAPKLSKAIAPVVAAKIIQSDEGKLATIGAVRYRQWCMHCHGLSGDGNGPTAGSTEHPFLNPRPRDYRLGRFKFTSTQGVPAIVKPTREDLLRTLRNGIPGTSMPSFALPPYQSDIEAVLDYVILLSIRGESERKVVLGGKISRAAIEEEATDVADSWASVNTKVVNPTKPRPPATEASLKRGRELFMTKGECVKCHGPKALGDGWAIDKSADPAKQKDEWGFQARPANLTLGIYRGGARPIDLFRRIQQGVKGTPMAAQKINIPDEEDIWHVVNFVRAIAYDDIDFKVAESPAASHESSTKSN